MNYKEEFDKYNLLDKEVLIGMLIEKSKLTDTIYSHDECNFYQAGANTSGRCMICNKLPYEHKNAIHNNRF